MSLPISRLIVTQHGIRHPESLVEMVSHVGDDGIFDKESIDSHSPQRSGQIIQISRMPDGKLYIHDGHHRCVSILWSGREQLDDREYLITDWTYEQYEDIMFADTLWKSWLTPMELPEHVRAPDIKIFKTLAQEIYEKEGGGEAMRFIEKNYHMYRQQRRYHGVGRLANQYRIILP